MATPNTAANPVDRAENSLRPAKKRRAERGNPAESVASVTQTKTGATDRAVPEEVRRRFVQVNHKYYFPDGARAFTDRGTRLTTGSENTEVIRSLILVAEARGWSEVTVRGTERFRREAWYAGQKVGIDVRGYRPTQFEQERLVRTMNRQGPAPVEDSIVPGEKPLPLEPEKRVRQRDELVTGRLVDHGPAPYRQDPHEPMSYFVKLETPRGDRTIWGVDLQRAFKESLTQPQTGDQVGLRSIRRDAVNVKTHERDAQGTVVDRERATHRNRWIVEKQDFFKARSKAAETLQDAQIDPKQAVKEYPELAGTYLQIRAAELTAERFRDPEDRRRFVGMVRSALAESIARGEPLPAVRVRERVTTRGRDLPERDAAPARG